MNRRTSGPAGLVRRAFLGLAAWRHGHGGCSHQESRELAEHAVANAGYRYSVEEVLFLEIKNRPGALAKAVEKLAKAKIDVKYVYATAYTKAQKTAAVVAVEEKDLEKAAKILR